MTDHDNHAEWTEVHALSGAYAVDALDDIERTRFEEHLHRCADCRAEVDSLREAAGALSVDPVDPPASLRAGVLAGIGGIRPLPPLTTAAPTRIEEGRGARRRSWLSVPLLAAAALVLVALTTTVFLRPWQDGDRGGGLSADAVLQADDVKSFAQSLPDGSAATIYVSRSEGAAVIKTSDMTLAPEGKVYELWLQRPDGHMVPAGLMPDDPDTTVLLHGDASESTGVGITVEPDGGSQQPTTSPILLFDLTA